MNKYICRIGDGNYSLRFCTDNKENFYAVKKVAELCEDGKNIQAEIEKKKRELYERDIPKKVQIDSDMGVMYEHCPICWNRDIRNGYCTHINKYGIKTGEIFKYCPNCGQKLDWNDIIMEVEE